MLKPVSGIVTGALASQGVSRVGFRLRAAERHFAIGASAGQDIIAIGQGAARHHAGVVEGAAPDDGRRNRTLAFPIGGDGLRGAGPPPLRRSPSSAVGEPACGFEVAQGAVEHHVDEIADPERVEHERFGAALRFAPSERIDPHEAERIAQQAAKRAGRLGAAEDGENERMIRPHEPVMGSDLRLPPVAPAALRADRLRIGGELLGPGHQAVGLAEGMRRRRVAAEVGFVAMPGEQRTASQEAPVAVAPGAREDDFVGRRGEDRLEVAAVGEVDRQRIEHRGRDDMVRDQPVLGDAARPARGIEAQEPHEAAGRRRERAGRHPGDGDARFQPVILLQGLQRRVDRGGGAGEQRLAPDRERPAR